MIFALELILLFILIIALSKTNEGAKEFVQAVNKEWMKSRTIFTALFFGTLVYCILNKISVPELLNTIVSTLLGYWFGQGKAAKKEGENT